MPRSMPENGAGLVVAFDFGKGGDGLAGVLFALGQAVANGDDGDVHLVAAYMHVPVPAKRTAHPAGVEPQGLS